MWTTYLTAVTLHVEVAVQGHNADSLLLAGCRHYGLGAHTAAWGELSVEENQERQKSDHNNNDNLKKKNTAVTCRHSLHTDPV